MMKAIHMQTPRTPSSSMIRTYSFSAATGSRIWSRKKYGMLVPPPPIPTPNGYSRAASTTGRSMLDEIRVETKSESNKVAKRWSLSLLDTTQAVNMSMITKPARAIVFNLNVNMETIATAKSTMVWVRLAPRNTPIMAATNPAQIRVLAHVRDSRFNAPNKNGMVITIVPEYAWAFTKNAGIRNAVLPATSRLLYINSV